MKKILLGVTGVRAKMRRGKMPQPFVTHMAAWKIKPAQRALDPHVHRKCRIKPVGEQQHAIGNFAPDAAQLHQFGPRLGQRQTAGLLQIKFAVGNLPCGRQQVRGAKSHLAGTEPGFAGGSNSFGSGKCEL